ncbi:MAG: hypothetical protein QXJ07_05530 [Candidatus Bathyarchaeia archaeon]
MYTIHISSHRYYNEKGTYSALPFSGKVYARDVEGLWKQRRPRKVKIACLSACFTGREDMIKAFSKAGCQYCIAPKKDPFRHDAVLFWTKFYTVLLLECPNSSPWIAFKKDTGNITKTLRKLDILQMG